MRFATKAIHVGEEPRLGEGGFGDVVVPIHLSTTFARKEVDRPTAGYEYSRTGNPTRDALEKRLAALENAKFGLAFASGLAAEATLLLSLLKSGDHVVASDDLYGWTRRLFTDTLKNFGMRFTFVDAGESDKVKMAIKKNTRLFWLETPSNPLMRLCDIQEISEIAKEKAIVTIVDNTFMSPYFQRPLDMGADIVVHSSTKYLNGHSDVVGGAIMLSDEGAHEKVRFNQNAIGCIPSPFDCYLVLRGIKTLPIRMERHSYNANKIADYLESHTKVKRVNYPGLTSHPKHALAKKQMSGFGGMLSFELSGKTETVEAFLRRLSIFAVAESLGGVESLIEQPALMTHSSIPERERKAIGITDSLVRISAGIEDAEDLIADLEQALRASRPRRIVRQTRQKTEQ